MKSSIPIEEWLRPDIEGIPIALLRKINEFDNFVVMSIIAVAAIKPNKKKSPVAGIRKIAKRCGIPSKMAGANLRAPGLITLGAYELFASLAIQFYFISRFLGLERPHPRADSLHLFLSSLMGITASILLFTDLPFMSLRGPTAIFLMGVSRALRYPVFMSDQHFHKKSDALSVQDVEEGGEEEKRDLIQGAAEEHGEESEIAHKPKHELIITDGEGKEACKISIEALVNCKNYVSENGLQSDWPVSYAKIRPLIFFAGLSVGGFIVSTHLNPFGIHRHANKSCLHSKHEVAGRGGMLVISPPMVVFALCEMIYAGMVFMQMHFLSEEANSSPKLTNKSKSLPLFASGGMSLLGALFLLTDPRIVDNSRLGVIGLFLIGVSTLLGHPSLRGPENVKAQFRSLSQGEVQPSQNQSGAFALRQRGGDQAQESGLPAASSAPTPSGGGSE